MSLTFGATLSVAILAKMLEYTGLAECVEALVDGVRITVEPSA